MKKNVSFPTGLIALLAVAFHLSSPNASERRPAGEAGSKVNKEGAKKDKEPSDEAPRKDRGWRLKRFFIPKARRKRL
jgi:hypothetical protein